MWSNVISIGKEYDKEIAYMLAKLKSAKDVSYAIEESEERVWIYLASACERQDDVESELQAMLEVVFLSFIKLRFFLERLALNKLNHAKCALLCSIIHFDREFESGIIAKTIASSLDYNVDGLLNFRLRALRESWQEIADVANRLLESSFGDDDVYDVASFIAGTDGGKNRLLVDTDGLKNLSERRLVEVVRLFDEEEYNFISAIIKERPEEISIRRKFSQPMQATLRRIARVVESC